MAALGRSLLRNAECAGVLVPLFSSHGSDGSMGSSGYPPQAPPLSFPVRSLPFGNTRIMMLSTSAAAGDPGYKIGLPVSEGESFVSADSEKSGSPCLNLDGIVVNPRDCTVFCGRLSCAVRGQSWVDMTTTDAVKRELMNLQFLLQKEKFSVRSKGADLNRQGRSAKAQEEANAATSADLLEREKALARKIFEDQKVEQVLEKVIKLLEASKAQNHICNFTEVPKTREAEESKHEKVAPLTSPAAKRLSCRVYLYGKGMLSANVGLVSPFLGFLVKIGNQMWVLDRVITVGGKYYFLAVMALVWYTSGLEPGEARDLIELRHIENKKKLKLEIAKYRDGKKKAKEEEKSAEEADAAESESREDKAKEEEKRAEEADDSSESESVLQLKKESEKAANTEACGDQADDAALKKESEKTEKKKWYFFYLK